MKFFRRRLRPFSVIALFAMWVLALAPTVSHALGGLRSTGGLDPWAELCSATSTSGDAAGQPGKAAGLHQGHCALCGVAHSPVLPPAEPAALSQSDGADYVAALFVQAPHTLFAWVAAQPRGPPSAS